jgi:Gas vesicle synthesis protein GvpL/GvpF
MTSTDTSQNTSQETAVYVYGIVPADVEVTEGARGVGDPPAEVTVVTKGDIAALVSEVPRERSLGTPEDFRAHAQLLDGAAAQAPVLPMRFGAVVADNKAVEDELLGTHQEQFREALKQLEGRAQYIVKGRYVEEAILREVLEENPQAAELRDRISGQDEDATRQDRIALGELINDAISRKREEDTRRVAETLQESGFEVATREATHELDAFQVACLGEIDRQGDLEDAVARLSDEWQGRVEVDLRGPLAAYDFVTTTKAPT